MIQLFYLATRLQQLDQTLPSLADSPTAITNLIRMLPLKKILLLTVFVFASASSAKDIDDQFAVFGVGAENCAAYLVARDRGGQTERWYHDWLAGYLSAVNTAAASTYDIRGGKSLADILNWLEGYCAVNPNMNFTNAVADMATVLFEERENLAPGKKGGWNKFVIQDDAPAPNPTGKKTARP